MNIKIRHTQTHTRTHTRHLQAISSNFSEVISHHHHLLICKVTFFKTVHKHTTRNINESTTVVIMEKDDERLSDIVIFNKELDHSISSNSNSRETTVSAKSSILNRNVKLCLVFVLLNILFLNLTINGTFAANPPPNKLQSTPTQKPLVTSAPIVTRKPTTKPPAPIQQHLRFEFQRYDGWYNNLANSDWGSPNSRLRRKVPPAYLDGVYLMDNDDKPSARLLSQKLMRGEDGKPSQRNLTTLFTFFGQVVASEILMASESGCPIEMHRIHIEKCDPMYDRDCTGQRTMPFYRASYDASTGQSPNLPREQINKVTSWIDGSFIYSTSETWLNTMRSFDGHGTLKMVHNVEDLASTVSKLLDTTFDNLNSPAPQLFGYPIRNKHRAPLINAAPAHHLRMKTPERMFLLGDPRTNQNPIILAFGILFYRWHNVLAERIYADHKDWTDEEIFQRARRLVIASLQNIVLYEYLPTLLDANSPEDKIAPYTGYKPDLHPGISHVFQSAAFRFGHTMIPPGLYLRDEKCQYLNTSDGYEGIRLCSTWWNAEEVVSSIGIEPLLMGAASQIAEREDYVLCNDVRDKLFGPLDFSRRDLASLNIMRGRDNGLADYNTVRRAFQLPSITNWTDINPVLGKTMPSLFDDLSTLYQNRLDNIDLYIGGMLESEAERGRPGPLFRRIIREQFERLRDADRFWFENTESGIFTKAEIEEIREITLFDIISNSTLIPEDSIQRDVFRFRPGDPCPQPKQLSSKQLKSCFTVKGWSYFKGSEVTFIMVCLTLIFIPIVCCLAAYSVIKLQNSKRRQYKARLECIAQHNQHQKQRSSSRFVNSVVQQHQLSTNDTVCEKLPNCEKFYAKEWLHSNLKRYVKVRLGPDETIYTLDRKGQTQRKLNLTHINTITVEISQDFSSDLSNQPSRNYSRKPIILIRVAREYDLVLQFQNIGNRQRFLNKLDDYLVNINKSIDKAYLNKEIMLANAETKEKRQQRLDQFFREAYALTFGLKTPTATSSPYAYTNEGLVTSSTDNIYSIASPDIRMIMRTSLSKQEFAEALGMRSDSLFVRQMFNCVDKDSDGNISFQEFLDTVVMFSKGKPEDKLRIVFDMCDHESKGLIEKNELVDVLRSLVDIAKTKSVNEDGINLVIQGMFESVGLQNKDLLTYDDFKTILGTYNDNGEFLSIGLDMKGAKKSFFLDENHSTTTKNCDTHLPDAACRRKMTLIDTGIRTKTNPLNNFENNGVHIGTKATSISLLARARNKINSTITYIEEHRQDIVYLLIFYVAVAVSFVERFVNYSYLSEHMDLRHVMGIGIAITRGSAAALSLCFALLLLTMCRKLMTKLRETPFREYIPLDSHIRFHKLVAYTGGVMTVVHTVGHCVNFWHISNQPVEHLRCMTKEMAFNSDSRPTFFFWVFETVTGTTGLFLWILCSIVFVFAHQKVRRFAYSYFWSTHKLYYAIYALTLLHGSSKLTGSPRFWIFFMLPAILFAIDQLISLQTKLQELEILETELLPSGKLLIILLHRLN